MQAGEKQKQELPIEEEMSSNPIVSVEELKGSNSTWEPESMMVEMEGCRFGCKFCSQTPSSIKMIKKSGVRMSKMVCPKTALAHLLCLNCLQPDS